MDASGYAEYLGLPERAEGETDLTFRRRVAVALREKKMVIEAAEVLAGDVRWDDPGQDPLAGPMAHLLGHVHRQMHPMQGAEGRDTLGQMEDEAITGALLRAGPDPREEAIRTLFGVLGPEAGMTVIEGLLGRDQPF